MPRNYAFKRLFSCECEEESFEGNKAGDNVSGDLRSTIEEAGPDCMAWKRYMRNVAKRGGKGCGE